MVTETAEAPVLEKPPAPFSTQVKDAMESLGNKLGDCPSAFTAITAPAIERLRSGQRYPKWVHFEEGGKQYRFSPRLHKREGYIPDDAMCLAGEGNSFFLQISHSTLNTSELQGEAALYFHGELVRGKGALEKAHEAFPRFYPAPRALRKVA